MVRCKIMSSPSDPVDDALDRKRWNFARAIILSGWVIMLAATAVILGAAAWNFITGREVPKDLLQFVNLVLGFYFGSFVAMVKDVLAAK